MALLSKYHQYILPLADVLALLCRYHNLEGGRLGDLLSLKLLRVSLTCITIHAQKCCGAKKLRAKSV